MRLLMLTAAAAAMLSLGACSSLGADNSAALLKQMDTNFAACDRHITFTAGVGVITPGAQVTGSVDCKGVAVSTAPASAAPAAN